MFRTVAISLFTILVVSCSDQQELYQQKNANQLTLVKCVKFESFYDGGTTIGSLNVMNDCKSDLVINEAEIHFDEVRIHSAPWGEYPDGMSYLEWKKRDEGVFFFKKDPSADWMKTQLKVNETFTLLYTGSAILKNPRLYLMSYDSGDSEDQKEPEEGEKKPGGGVSDDKLYVHPNYNIVNYAKSASSDQDRRILEFLKNQPMGIWLGEWTANIEQSVADIVRSAGNSTAVFVAYNIPQRDCGQHSAGGLGTGEAYRRWISSLAKGIGGGKAIVILEPDAVTLQNCLDTAGLRLRNELLRYGVKVLKENPNTKVYIDGGHARWLSPDDLASKLVMAGIEGADGFSLNVSNYIETRESVEYGKKVVRAMGMNKKFVIDTSRNGNGSNGEWCNPSGRAVGELPTLKTMEPSLDAILWVKVPGESDGACNGGPGAGTFWPERAIELVKASRHYEK